MGLVSKAWVMIALGCVSVLACARADKRANAKIQLEPLPSAVRLCVNAVTALPAKPDGKPWDCCGGKISPSTMSSLAAAAATGGIAGVQAISAAGSLLSSGVTAPELRVQLYLDNHLRLTTPMVKNSTQAHWVSDNCVEVEQAQYRRLFRVIVEDVDLSDDDLVGQRTLAGIPDEAIRARVWRVKGFGSVAEMEFIIQPADEVSGQKTLNMREFGQQ